MKIRSALTLAIGLLAATGNVARAQFRKSNFVATKPGAWSRYSVSYGAPPTMEYTYRRLPDEKGRPRIEFTMEFKSGQAKGKRFVYVSWFKPGFPIEKDALSYGNWITAMTTQQGKNKPRETSASELAATAAMMANYDSIARYVDSAVVEGKVCDHYRYEWSPPAKPPRVESGNLWLNGTVPFGIVKSDMTIKNKAGQTVSTMQTKLVASGNR
jgi:hypothetical protein